VLFSSVGFIFAFLPVVFALYYLINRYRFYTAAKGWLVIASLFFYGWWNPAYLPLILVSLLVNYSLGSMLLKQQKKSVLLCGIVFNLGLLGYFKYTDFFIANLNNLTGSYLVLPGIVLPLAISFFTFQQIAYLVDSYRKETTEYSALNYMLFVTFFPQLIAGPIVHHKEMMPQFEQRINVSMRYKNIAVGLFIFMMGMFKKVVLADTFAQWVNTGFDSGQTLQLIDAWITSLSYTFQLYFDFSGYSDMAIGIALLFNIHLPLNFNSPYKASSIQDFWRRWHMTLSRFLRDYVYIPLGGNRAGRYLTYQNLFLTFLIGGLWHGASWMFVIWGALHGGALVLHRLWQAMGAKMPLLLAWFVTFNFINITWVFFRAVDMTSALNVLSGMVGLNGIALPSGLAGKLPAALAGYVQFQDWLVVTGATAIVLPLLAGTILFTALSANSLQIAAKFKPDYRFFALLLFFTSALFFIRENQPFLYFDF
jgi:D-alanyl-lipoteichoic acid acyltransferase DltB (MBOAT superfamily)